MFVDEAVVELYAGDGGDGGEIGLAGAPGSVGETGTGKPVPGLGLGINYGCIFTDADNHPKQGDPGKDGNSLGE